MLEEITLYKKAKIGIATIYKNKNFVDFDVYSAEKIFAIMFLAGFKDPDLVGEKLNTLIQESTKNGYIIMYSELYKELEKEYS